MICFVPSDTSVLAGPVASSVLCAEVSVVKVKVPPTPSAANAASRPAAFRLTAGFPPPPDGSTRSGNAWAASMAADASPGVGSGSYNKYVSVWCNADPQDSMTRAKLGEPVAPATCDNPVATSYQLGQQVGVRGTPTIIFDDGTIIGGYKPSAELISILGLDG